jgi:hypothetical protein
MHRAGGVVLDNQRIPVQDLLDAMEALDAAEAAS